MLGIGTKIFVYAGKKVQLQEEVPVRGYLSSVDRSLVFGLGKESAIDSIIIIWPDDKKQKLTNVPVDTTLTCFQKNATERFVSTPTQTKSLFAPAVNRNITYKHSNSSMNDFAQQRLLPQKYSQLGPFMASGDVNKDGRTDFYIGGGFNAPGKIFIQNSNGSFSSNDLKQKNNLVEDAACTFFDADKDGDEDLLVTNGGLRFSDSSANYIPRLFINDGTGSFSQDETAIPTSVKTIAGCVQAADYDGDGDLDVFIGGRVSGQYPVSPRSFLLQNNGGKFVDVTEKVCPALKQAGMICSAVWADINKDKKPELILAGEWMPLRFFKNENGQLKEVTAATGLTKNSGMWRSLSATDIDNDGDIDLIAGNLGQNCKYHISASEPMKLFAKDLDGNGSIDPVPFYYIKNEDGKKELYPAINRDMLAEQVPAVKKLFLKHADYAKAEFKDIFSKKEGTLEFDCEETSSCYFENTGDGAFVKHLLPKEAQFAPVNSIICEDLDSDGMKDLLLAGNEYQTEVMTGRYDASYGLFLKGSKQGFTPVRPTESGFILTGDVKSLQLIKTAANKKLVLAAINNDSLRVFELN